MALLDQSLVLVVAGLTADGALLTLPCGYLLPTGRLNHPPHLPRQMMANHKVAAEKLKDRHARQTHGLAKAHNLAMANLEGAHRVERWRVVDNCKKQARGGVQQTVE